MIFLSGVEHNLSWFEYGSRITKMIKKASFGTLKVIFHVNSENGTNITILKSLLVKEVINEFIEKIKINHSRSIGRD